MADYTQEKKTVAERNVWIAQKALETENTIKEQLKYERENHARSLKRIRTTSKARLRLVRELAKCGYYVDYFRYGVQLDCETIEKYRSLRQQLGVRFEVSGKTLSNKWDFSIDERESVDTDKWVKVSMSPIGDNLPEYWQELTVTYLAPLTPDCQCKVEETTHTSKSLVCTTPKTVDAELVL